MASKKKAGLTGGPTTAGNVTLEIVTLTEAYNTDDGGRGDNVGTIGYYTTPQMAKSACVDNPYTGTRAILNYRSSRSQRKERIRLTAAQGAR